MADPRVLQVQEWLNETFPKYFKCDNDNKVYGSYPVEMDGKTGTKTVKALIMAIQIHYNLTPVDGIWGSGTSSACPVINEDVTDPVIIRIAQGAFYCKGYEAGGFDGKWRSQLSIIIDKYKSDLGLPGSTSMEQNVFKSLLTTDPTVLTSKGTKSVRDVQKYLNGNYSNLFVSKLGYIPTGGFYERKTSKALIYAFQKEIGTTADGSLGSASFTKMPGISEGCTNTRLVKLLQAALICNGYETSFDGVYDAELSKVVTAFQKFMCLGSDAMVSLGSVNRRTWGALFQSKGDTARTPNACDCHARIMDVNVAVQLFSRGFRYIGRYLTRVPGGLDKALTPEEVGILLDAGLKIFPIYQESFDKATDFNKSAGRADAVKAINAAISLGFKQNTILYFAIDCDMTEEQISTYGLPYFEGIHEVLEDSKYYKAGVYGARNTCRKVQEAYPGTKCFVSDMSTGYSGNLGYRMPENWAFEQYREVSGYSVAGTSFDLDYDMASENAEGVSSVDSVPSISGYKPPYNPSEDGLKTDKPTIRILDLLPAITWLEEEYYNFYHITEPTDDHKRICARIICDYLSQYAYNDLKWDYIAPKDDHFIAHINKDCVDNEYVKTLHPYIYTATENECAIRPQLVKDGHLGLFELPHLAIVIRCYLMSPVPGDWAAWAGDFSSGVKETYINGKENGFLDWAVKNFGASEPDVASALDARQFNYYDLIADLDGYALRELLRTIPSFSECLQEYYSNTSKYDKRYQYFKDILGFKKWDQAAICAAILDYFHADENLWVRMIAKDYNDNPGSVEAAATALACNILYWAKETGVFTP